MRQHNYTVVHCYPSQNSKGAGTYRIIKVQAPDLRTAFEKAMTRR